MNILRNAYSSCLLIAFAIVFFPISAQSEEIPARGPIPFAAYDKDGNGLIGKEEFRAVRGERRATRAAEGRPMRGAASAPAFSKLDTNGDGQLTQEELTAGQKAQMERRRRMRMGRGHGTGRGMVRNMPAFSEYDLDGDGRILEKEFNEARSKRISERAQQDYRMKNLGKAPSFTDIDANGNGEISVEEFAAHQSWCCQQRAQQRAQ